VLILLVMNVCLNPTECLKQEYFQKFTNRTPVSSTHLESWAGRISDVCGVCMGMLSKQYY